MMNYGGPMGVGYGSPGMESAGFFGLVTWIVILVDLILLGLWLWQHIMKK